VMKELHIDLFEPLTLDAEARMKEDGGNMDLAEAVDSFEKGIIKHACEKYGSSRKAAAALGISQTQLIRKKNKYNI